MSPFDAGIDADALMSGFAFGLVVTLTVWWALVVLSLLRRVLSDA